MYHPILQFTLGRGIMRRLTVNHVTTYNYKEAVSFGPHRMMLRPRDSHDLRLLKAGLTIDPAPDRLRWLYDVFGNSVAVASFVEQSAVLKISSELDLEQFVSDLPDCPIETYAETYPFAYSAEDIPDLHRLIERQYPDEQHEVDLWAKRFVNAGSETCTLAMLTTMTQAIKSEFRYAVRFEQGCQPPVETLNLKSGSCRDFALLMMEAVRALGLAARFVSGYVYVPSANNGNGNVGGATHAWLQVYLPGAGWLEFDPTNGLVGNRDLIRVAVVRDPGQAIPISGEWTGAPADFIGMAVDVSVTENDRAAFNPKTSVGSE
jgi:transglutaminase-like putative cysteine protease